MKDGLTHAAWLKQTLETQQGPLMRYALHLLGDLEQAREVVQETFLKLCQVDRKSVENHLSEWLFAVCRNRAVDVLRKRKPTEPLNAHITTQPSREPSPAETLEYRQTATQVLAVVDALPEKQREVVRLKFQNGMSYAEIGKITGLSASHVGVLLCKAMKTLRAEFKVSTKKKKTRRAS